MRVTVEVGVISGIRHNDDPFGISCVVRGGVGDTGWAPCLCSERGTTGYHGHVICPRLSKDCEDHEDREDRGE